MCSNCKGAITMVINEVVKNLTPTLVPLPSFIFNFIETTPGLKK